jgi:Cyclin, N-terminal domain
MSAPLTPPPSPKKQKCEDFIDLKWKHALSCMVDFCLEYEMNFDVLNLSFTLYILMLQKCKEKYEQDKKAHIELFYTCLFIGAKTHTNCKVTFHIFAEKGKKEVLYQEEIFVLDTLKWKIPFIAFPEYFKIDKEIVLDIFDRNILSERDLKKSYMSHSKFFNAVGEINNDS